MMAKKETTGNGEVQRSAATRWAALSSAATLGTSRAAATTAPSHSNGEGNSDDGDGNTEHDGTSSSATARRNANPVGVGDKDAFRCNGRNDGAPRQRQT